MPFRDETETLRRHARELDEEIMRLERQRARLDSEARELEDTVGDRARIVGGGSWKIFLFVAPLVVGIGVFAVYMASSNPGAETLYGRVASTRWSAPVSEGARCTAFLTPVGDDDSSYDVQMDLLCGGRLVYGGGTTGFVQCEGVSTRPARCVDAEYTDESGDPQMELNRAEGRIRVEERGWRLDIELSTPGEDAR